MYKIIKQVLYKKVLIAVERNKLIMYNRGTMTFA